MIEVLYGQMSTIQRYAVDYIECYSDISLNDLLYIVQVVVSSGVCDVNDDENSDDFIFNYLKETKGFYELQIKHTQTSRSRNGKKYYLVDLISLYSI